jgi:hypothetical protein
MTFPTAPQSRAAELGHTEGPLGTDNGHARESLEGPFSCVAPEPFVAGRGIPQS